MIQKKLLASAVAVALTVGLTGCGGSSNSDNNKEEEVALTYNFQSRFINGAESAQYPGQTTRHVLIADLNTTINGLKPENKTQQDIVDVLNSFYQEGTAAIGDNALLLTTDPATKQDTYNEISTDKNLVGKTAGNDDVTDHKDWDGGDFVGWNTSTDPDSPNQLIQDWFNAIGANVESDFQRSTPRTDPVADGKDEELEVYHTDDGLDLKQLVQKFLLGAVPFSQGTDDYLDDATANKGLLTDNTSAADNGAAAFTDLEHQWDEGFGYFGAARDYLAYTDEEIAGKGGRAAYENGYHDTDNDGAIDLVGEFNFGHSQNAAKRDLGSQSGTDFTKQAMEAFLAGRALISAADGALSDAELEELQGVRNQAVEAWENAIAATVVHYINDVLGDMDNADANDGSYSYIDHTKHWSELKGFALGLQFNPRSPLNASSDNQSFDTLFAEFHGLVSERPSLPGAQDFSTYRDDLISARTLMQNAYGFAEEDVLNW
ncbi:MAG: DUF4856 domain-containing protein [Oleiphilaceae bacterium]|nr:DUF4856 domain-containing protein [Oleiphilaceae bacterium]